MNRAKINIILVEDHKIVRKGLRALLELEEDFCVLEEAEDGLEALKVIEHLKPDLVIMDIALPKMNGIEVAKQVLKFPEAPYVLFLSAHRDDGYIEKALALGVAGYLVKQCSPNLLIQAVRDVMAGKKYYSPLVLERLSSIRNGALGRSVLSDRELQVLQLIAEGQANKQVAADLSISIKTVEKHRQNLMKKLCLHDTAGLTRYAISEGIIETSLQKTTL